MADESGKQRFEVHTIVKRDGQNGEVKSFWVRVGSAFTNKDGSINVFLDALPVNGQLQLRVPQPRDEQGGGQQNNNRGQRQQGQGQRGGRGGDQW